MEQCSDAILWCKVPEKTGARFITMAQLHSPNYYNMSCVMAQNHSSPPGVTQICVNSFDLMGNCVQEGLVLISSIMAVIIGIVGYRWFNRNSKRCPNSFNFALAYLLFAIMMGLGSFAHCFTLLISKEAKVIVGLNVLSLTATIAVAFGVAAAVQFGWLRDDSCASVGLVFASYIFFSAFDIYMFATGKNFMYDVYVWPILIGCGLFAVQLAVRLWRARKVLPFVCCVVGAFFGGFGLYAAMDLTDYLCRHYPMWLSPQGVWYLFSDISMVCVAVAYATSASGGSSTIHYEGVVDDAFLEPEYAPLTATVDEDDY